MRMWDALPCFLTVIMKDIDLPCMMMLVKTMPVRLEDSLNLFNRKIIKGAMMIRRINDQLMNRSKRKFVRNNSYLPTRITGYSSDTIELSIFLMFRAKRTGRLSAVGDVRPFSTPWG